MGLFCVSFHFRTTDDRALSEALKRRGVTRYRIVPARHGWTALYEERASQQDDSRIRDLASGLSADLNVAAIAFLVHDSDIACYWLFDKGRLLDDYNSDPDYFSEDYDGPPSPSGGRPDVLLGYCRPGTRREKLAEILGEENVQATTFAEDVIGRLARALGIDEGLALADYRDAAGEDGPGGMGGFDDDGDDDDGGPGGASLRTGLLERLSARLGLVQGGGPADPQATALVQAAAKGDTGEIDRLLADGVAIDQEAPAPIPGVLLGGMAQLLPGGLPQMAMTPLLAAIAHKQHAAVERLLSAGADPNFVHPRFGTAAHAAAGTGDVELLQLVLDRGGDVNARNALGHTPLQTLAASLANVAQLTQLQAAWKAMGTRIPGHLANLSLPVEGWNACEELLKARGGK